MKYVRPTQNDVARLAGVSRQTVSLVTNADPRVSEESRNAVLAAMKELGYRTNAAARQLASRRSDTVGIVCADLLNPFIAEQIEAIRRTARVAGFSVVVFPVEENARSEREALERLVETDAAGAIMVAPLADRDTLEEYGKLLAIVALGRNIRVPGVSFVRPADEAGAAQVTRHLIDQQYDPVVFVGPFREGEGDSSQERYRGYSQTMCNQGLLPARIVTRIEYQSEIYRFLSEHGHGTAFVCHNDKIALDVASAAIDHGLALGSQVGVAGYDNSYLSQYSGLQLTTVDMHIQVMAERALELLQTMLIGETQDADVVVTPTLVMRDSTDRHQ